MTKKDTLPLGAGTPSYATAYRQTVCPLVTTREMYLDLRICSM